MGNHVIYCPNGMLLRFEGGTINNNDSITHKAGLYFGTAGLHAYHIIKEHEIHYT